MVRDRHAGFPVVFADKSTFLPESESHKPGVADQDLLQAQKFAPIDPVSSRFPDGTPPTLDPALRSVLSLDGVTRLRILQHHASGNYGALDQLAAVNWVKNNIAGFGGDPEKITLWGQSGGSRSVNWLVASPSARGLARGAIAQSHTVFGRMSTLKGAEQNGVEFAKAAGKTSLADLRAMSSQQIFDAFRQRGTGLNGTIVDGWFLPTDVYTIFAEGKQNLDQKSDP